MDVGKQYEPVQTVDAKEVASSSDDKEENKEKCKDESEDSDAGFVV